MNELFGYLPILMIFSILLVDDSASQSQSSNRSRSRSASVELIPEVDIFGRG